MFPSKPYIRFGLLYDFKSGLSAAESSRRLCTAFGAGTVSERTAQDWFTRFRSGDESLDDQPRSGRPTAVDDDRILQLLHDDPRLSAPRIAEQLGVSSHTITDHLHSLGKVYKVNQWVPHDLTDFDRQRRCDAATSLLSFRRTNDWLESVVTGDEKWCLFYNERRRRSWVAAGSSAQPQPKTNLHPRKVMLSIWWDCRGVLYWELLNPGQSINAEVYCAQLDRVAAAFETKRPRHGPIRFIHDNARPHTAAVTRNKLIELGWEVMPHPPYSPDLAPSDYYLFRSLSNAMDGRAFEDQDDLETWLTQYFESKPGDYYKRGIDELPNRWRQVINNNGDYILD